MTEGSPEAEPDLFVSEGREISAALCHKWPDGTVEEFFRAEGFDVTDGIRVHHVELAWARRKAWGKQDRLRAVAFYKNAGPDSDDRYPLTEWVECDVEGFMAAGIPNPATPRALLKDGDGLPVWLQNHQVQRSDQLFHAIKQGPSLRLVARPDDPNLMVRFAIWVGRTRGRVPEAPQRALYERVWGQVARLDGESHTAPSKWSLSTWRPDGAGGASDAKRPAKVRFGDLDANSVSQTPVSRLPI
jgi:hypothetical protein